MKGSPAVDCRPQTSCDTHDGVTRRNGRVGERGEDIVSLERRVIGDDLFDRRTVGEQLKQIRHTHARATDAWTTSTLARLNRDALEL